MMGVSEDGICRLVLEKEGCASRKIGRMGGNGIGWLVKGVELDEVGGGGRGFVNGGNGIRVGDKARLHVLKTGHTGGSTGIGIEKERRLRNHYGRADTFRN